MNHISPAQTCVRRYRAGAIAALAALSVGLSAPAMAASASYEIDPEHFAVSFSVHHIGYADVIGLFLRASGEFVYDEEARTLSSGRVVVDADSVFTNHERRDEHVRNKDFLNVGKHPQIVFEATGFEPLEGGRGTLHGNLTLLGKTQPVTLDVTVNKADVYPFGHKQHTLGLSATTTLRRSEWGMVYGVSGDLVGDEVQLRFELEAIRR